METDRLTTVEAAAGGPVRPMVFRVTTIDGAVGWFETLDRATLWANGYASGYRQGHLAALKGTEETKTDGD